MYQKRGQFGIIDQTELDGITVQAEVLGITEADGITDRTKDDGIMLQRETVGMTYRVKANMIVDHTQGLLDYGSTCKAAGITDQSEANDDCRSSQGRLDYGSKQGRWDVRI